MKVKKILFIEDDAKFLDEFSSYLKRLHYTVLHTNPNQEGSLNQEGEIPDLIIFNPLFMNQKVEDNYDDIKAKYPNIPLIVITDQKNYDVIVQCISFGALDYITKPANVRELQILMHRIISLSSMSIHIKAAANLYQDLIDTYEKQLRFSIATGSSQMMKIVDTIPIIASKDKSNVYLTGEIGVGKEAVAHSIQELSKRRNKPFIKFDCSSVSSVFFDSELFGHTKNMFTGMQEEKVGILEAALGGIIYLQEISLVPLPVQQKLIQVLKTGKFKKTGSDKTISIDVRFISSTRLDMSKMISNKLFLPELFELLSGYRIDILPLRERKEDIILLSKHFISMYAEIMQRPLPEITQDVIQLFLAYPFPENVKELKQLIRKAMMLSDKEAHVLYREDFPDLYIERPKAEALLEITSGFQSLEILDSTEKQWIIQALKFYKNNKTHVAKALHITRQSLNRRIEKHGIKTQSDT